MRILTKKEDKVISSLLRHQIERAAEDRVSCGGFDPDLAAAYMERRLAETEKASYEGHLSLCQGCRRAIVTLMSATENDREPVAQPAYGVPGGTGAARGRIAALVAVLARPQWALAASAAVVLAISVPLWLSYSRSPRTAVVDQVSEIPAAPAEQKGVIAGQVPAGSLEADGTAESTQKHDSPGTSRKPVSVGQAVTGSNAPAREANDAGGEGLVGYRPDETKNQVAGTEDNRRKDEAGKEKDAGRVAPPSTNEASAKKLTQIEPEKARKLPSDEHDTTTVEVLKPRTSGGIDKASEAEAIRSTGPTAQPGTPVAPESAAGRQITRRSAAMMLRDKDSVEESRSRTSSEVIRVGKKRFYLLKDTWTDAAYDPSKDLPVVTLVRGSDVYQEELGKHRNLARCAGRIPEDARAIIVHDKTVYRLIPQEGPK